MTRREFHLISAISIQARALDALQDAVPQWCGGCETCCALAPDMVTVELRNSRYLAELCLLRAMGRAQGILASLAPADLAEVGRDLGDGL